MSVTCPFSARRERSERPKKLEQDLVSPVQISNEMDNERSDRFTMYGPNTGRADLAGPRIHTNKIMTRLGISYLRE